MGVQSKCARWVLLTGQHEDREPVRDVTPHRVLQLPLVINRPRRRVVRVGPALRHQQLAAPRAEGRQVRADLVDEGAHAAVDERDVRVPVERAHVVGEVAKDHVLQDRRGEGVGQGARGLLDELVLAAEREARVEAVARGVARAAVDLLQRGDLGLGEARRRIARRACIACQRADVEVAGQGVLDEAVLDAVELVAVVQDGALDQVEDCLAGGLVVQTGPLWFALSATEMCHLAGI